MSHRSFNGVGCSKLEDGDISSSGSREGIKIVNCELPRVSSPTVLLYCVDPVRIEGAKSSLNAIINANGMGKRKGKEPITSTYQAIRSFQPSYKAGYMLGEAEEVYRGFNAAQAR